MSGQTLTDEGWLYGSVAATDNTTTVYTGRCLLRRVIVAVAISAHLTLIKDNTTTVGGLPASAAAGTVLDMGDMTIGTSLIVDPDDAATAGTIIVVYKPLHDTANASPGPFPR